MFRPVLEISFSSALLGGAVQTVASHHALLVAGVIQLFNIILKKVEGTLKNVEN